MKQKTLEVLSKKEEVQKVQTMQELQVLSEQIKKAEEQIIRLQEYKKIYYQDFYDMATKKIDKLALGSYTVFLDQIQKSIDDWVNQKNKLSSQLDVVLAAYYKSKKKHNFFEEEIKNIIEDARKKEMKQIEQEINDLIVSSKFNK